MSLPKYRDWKPSTFDQKGLAFRGQTDEADWLVAPCKLTRDSDALERSNWDAQHHALDLVNEDSYNVLEFNHWACGWFRIVLVKPNTRAHKMAEGLSERLEDYPVLDEELWSRYEAEDNGYGE